MTRRGVLLLSLLGLIWGLPYLLIKTAVGEVTPALLVFIRTAGGALILVPVAAHAGALRPVLRRWRVLLVFAGVEIAGPWYVLSSAEQRLSSSLSGLLVATAPLVGGLLALITRTDRLDRRRIAGLLLGFAGVACLVGFSVAPGSLGSACSIGLVAIGYALGPWIIAHRLADLPALGVVAATLAACAVVYAPFGLTELPARSLSGDVVASIVTLTVLCTAIAFLVAFAFVREVGAMRSMVVTYVNPAVAVVLGVAVRGEQVGVSTGVGFALIIAGSLLATGQVRHG